MAGPTPDEGSPGIRTNTFIAGLNNYDLYLINSDGNGPNTQLPPDLRPIGTIEPTRLTRDFRQTDRSLRPATSDFYPNRTNLFGRPARSSADGTGSFVVQNIQPSFSPDGRNIVFASNRRPVSELLSDGFFDQTPVDPNNNFDLWRIFGDSRTLVHLVNDTPQRIDASFRRFPYNLRPSWAFAVGAGAGAGISGTSTNVNRNGALGAASLKPPLWDIHQ